MKLTNYHKQVIVRSIVQNLPKLIHPTAEQIQAATERAMKPAVRRLYKTHPEALKAVYIRGWDYQWVTSAEIVCGDVDLGAVTKPYTDARAARDALVTKISVAVNSCNTRKQLVDRYPEFAGYAPAEGGVTPNLPAVVGLITELKEAGWTGGK